MTTADTIPPPATDRDRQRAEDARVRALFAHKPGPDELFTPEEWADGAPFYEELRRCAAALIDARTAAGLTVEQVAEKAELSAAVVADFESGSTNPAWRTLGMYAVAVGKSLRLAVE